MFGAMNTHTLAVSRGIRWCVEWGVECSWVPLPRLFSAPLLGSSESIAPLALGSGGQTSRSGQLACCVVACNGRGGVAIERTRLLSLICVRCSML